MGEKIGRKSFEILKMEPPNCTSMLLLMVELNTQFRTSGIKVKLKGEHTKASWNKTEKEGKYKTRVQKSVCPEIHCLLYICL